MPCVWISCDSPLAVGEHIGLVVQSDMLSVQLTARVEGVDRVEATNRRTPIFLERGVSIPYPPQYYYLVSITSPVRPAPSAQADRKAVVSFGGRVSSDHDAYQVLIADMSRGGARVLSTQPIEGNEVLELSCEVDGKVVRLPAVRRYIRQELSKEGLYSIGLRFEHVSRIDAARWKTRLNEAHINPARAQSSANVLEPESGPNGNPATDLRTIANKLLAKIREVNRAERRLLGEHLAAHQAHIGPDGLKVLEAQLDVMARHKEQFAENLASTIAVMHAKIESSEAA